MRSKVSWTLLDCFEVQIQLSKKKCRRNSVQQTAIPGPQPAYNSHHWQLGSIWRELNYGRNSRFRRENDKCESEGVQLSKSSGRSSNNTSAVFPYILLMMFPPILTSISEPTTTSLGWHSPRSRSHYCLSLSLSLLHSRSLTVWIISFSSLSLSVSLAHRPLLFLCHSCLTISLWLRSLNLTLHVSPREVYLTRSSLQLCCRSTQ